ncbi:hypothetical protein [Prauserella muralis]|uniref:Uncharacterized protein n=1 Tax=Prauserella muralis TaxID=588067 RepID=A0A2V4B210_9PSEU|nr:hypothetical protein [Prauserella muralis]PXY27418.1 hypothetical protein BAY60_13365 [Prauserella muralis]TWE22883.1 hypothetical protein FHX69_4139 [Prauserella muralis]
MGDTRSSEAKEASEARKDAVLRMRRDGMDFEAIGAALDPPVSKQRAHQIYAEALRQIPAQSVAEYRAEQEQRLDELRRQALAVLGRDHLAVSQGRVVRLSDDGPPVLDDMPKLRAVETILKIEERLARLRGIDVPTKAQVEGNVQVKYLVEGINPKELT